MRKAARAPAKPPALQQAEDQLQCVIDLAADFYWEQDAELRFTFYRPRAEPDEDLRDIIGKTSDELCAIYPNNSAAVDRQRAAVEAREVFRNITYRIDSASNGARYFGFSGQPVVDQRGRFKGYRGIAIDVTAQIRAERLTQLEHAVSRILAEAEDVKAGIGAVVEALCASEQWTAGNFWTVDEAGALRHLVAWTPADKGPQSVLAEDAALPSWLNAGPVWIGDVGRRLGELDAGAPESWNTGLVIPIKSGSEIIGVVDFYAPKIASPEPQFLRVLRLASAEIGHFYQRALAMERLRESEERFSSTMKLAAIGIAHVDDSGRFIYANPQLCEMLGYSERELLALTVKQISHPGDAAASDDLHARLRAGAISSFKLEKRYLRKDRHARLGGAHDRDEAQSRRLAALRHLGGRGYLRSQARRGANPVSRDPRRPHRSAESRDVRAAAESCGRDEPPLRAQVRGAVHRPRSLQGDQRHARPRGRRRAAARDGGAPARVPARKRRRRRGSAATSSSCSCRRSPTSAKSAWWRATSSRPS